MAKLGSKQSPEVIAKRMANPNVLKNLFKTGHPPSEIAKAKLIKWNKGKKAEQSPSWKGDTIGYQGVHKWLARTFGKASTCEMTECNGKSQGYVWAKIDGKEYDRKRENFWQLCNVCHHIYDKTGERSWVTRNKKYAIPL